MARSLRAAFGPTNLEVSGIDIEFVLDANPGEELSIWMHCRRAGGANQAYRARLEKQLRPHRATIQAAGTLPEPIARMIYLNTYSETVVTGWWTVERGVRRETVPLDEGNELPFTPANFIMLMKEAPDLFDQLRLQVDGPSNFREAEEDPEADAGNS